MTETEKIDLLFKAVKYVAELWRKFGFPVKFERELTIDGVKVRVSISAPDLEPKPPESALENYGKRKW